MTSAGDAQRTLCPTDSYFGGNSMLQLIRRMGGTLTGFGVLLSPDYNLDSIGPRYCLTYECCVNRKCLQSRSPIASPKLFRRRPSVNPPIPVPTPAVLIESVTSPAKPPLGIHSVEPPIRHSSVPPSLFVEHVSQLYDPDCKFCLKSTVDPQHSDCQKMQIFTRGNEKMVAM